MESQTEQPNKLRVKIMAQVREAIARFDWAGLNMTVNKPQRDLINVLARIRDKKMVKR